MMMAATYQKELYAIVEAVYKWRQYQIGRRFLTRTDHKSIKELMQQVIQTPVQQQYVRKLMGFDFDIEYKPGATNIVADALSRMHSEDDTETVAFMSLSRPIIGLLESLKEEHRTLEGFRVQDGLLIFHGRYYVGLQSKLKLPLLKEFQETRSAGHCGTKKMPVGLSANFYWKDIRKMVNDFVRNCLICQQKKYSTQAPGGLLQPLPTPEAVWEDVSMDFIMGLPLSKGVTVIFVVVDRLTKYAHFGALPTSYNAHRVAELFIDIVVKHHGFPKTVVSDRDAIFVSQFWSSLFKLSGTQLKYIFVGDGVGATSTVVQILRLGEFCYNSSYHSRIRMSPYQALYGKLPPSLILYPTGKSKLAALDDMLVEKNRLIRQLKDNLAIARNRMEINANQKRREVEFVVGDKVLVKLRPYRQILVAKRLSNKLSKRFYGPFEVSERIGKVAYRLILPETSKIHPVFHVSMLPRYKGEVEAGGVQALPIDFEKGSPIEQPLSICGVRSVLSRGKPSTQVLVQWTNSSPENATWEGLREFQLAYPDFHLEDKVLFEAKGNDTQPAVEGARRTRRVSVAPRWKRDYVMDKA
ncbi:hypothetical protein OSB04_028837 [Centaurea solstitialis]|uniref:Integrase catalytic domain-containing protein n=1 Tax=Centaurea solstitialis TaxID=347529 RepID=A0AA38WBK4_9ASTR|nr:hypothetical protein OSB04_028837 [Centaurea solstitialis]